MGGDDDTLPAEVMEITPNHPVYVEGRGWVEAEDLALGDRLRRADGGWARVVALERVVLAAPQMVYNLTVRGMYSYFVLEVGVLVHNCDIVTAANPTEAQKFVDEIIGASPGQRVLLRGMSSHPIRYPELLRAPRFRGPLHENKTVLQISNELKGTNWRAEAQRLGGGYAITSHNSPFLAATTRFKTARQYASGYFKSDKGYIIAFSVTDPLRLPIANPYPHFVDKIEIFVPVGITESEIYKIIHISSGLR